MIVDKRIYFLMRYGQKMMELYESLKHTDASDANTYLDVFQRCVYCIRILDDRCDPSPMLQVFINEIERTKGRY